MERPPLRALRQPASLCGCRQGSLYPRLITMAPQAPWSPTALSFAHHQFAHVANFWKQGRQAIFRLETLPGGQAELNLTFQLPRSSEVIPPPSQVPPVPAPQRPIHPLFPECCSPQRSASAARTKPASHKKISSKQRKSYRRSVQHTAALAIPSLPPPMKGSLRQAALVCVQRLQAASVLPMNNQSANKRPLPDSPSANSPSNLPPLAQRIRSDLQIGEESPERYERELLRTQPTLQQTPMNYPFPCSPRAMGFPPPGPLVFTPPKTQEDTEIPVAHVEDVICCNCEQLMTLEHQCEETTPVSSSAIAPAVPCLDIPPSRDVESVLSKPVAEPKISTKTDSELSSKTPPLPRRRGLNINTYCVKCDKRHPVWNKCQC